MLNYNGTEVVRTKYFYVPSRYICPIIASKRYFREEGSQRALYLVLTWKPFEYENNDLNLAKESYWNSTYVPFMLI